AVGGSSDGVLRFWDVETGRLLQSLAERAQGGQPLLEGERGVRSLAVSPDGRQVLVGYGNGRVILWDRERGRSCHILSGHARPVHVVSFAPSEGSAWTLADELSLRKWNLETGRQTSVIDLGGSVDRKKGGHLTSAAISADSRYALTSSYPGSSAQLWELGSGRKIRSFEGIVTEVRSVAYSPDGSHILVASGDGVRLWQVSSGRVTRSYLGDPYLHPIAFSPDG